LAFYAQRGVIHGNEAGELLRQPIGFRGLRAALWPGRLFSPFREGRAAAKDAAQDQAAFKLRVKGERGRECIAFALKPALQVKTWEGWSGANRTPSLYERRRNREEKAITGEWARDPRRPNMAAKSWRNGDAIAAEQMDPSSIFIGPRPIA
jgi:hypothetical protein